jgi:hypothetical protein
MDVKQALQNLIRDAVRAEAVRVLARVADPVRARVDEVITEAVRRAAAPIPARVEHLVGDAAHRAVDAVLKTVWPDGKRRAGVAPAGDR